MIKGEKKPENLVELERLVRENPRNPDLRIKLGADYLMAGFDRLAEDQYRAALLIDSKCACAYDAMMDILKIKSKKPGFEKNALGQMAAVMAIGETNRAYAEGAGKLLL